MPRPSRALPVFVAVLAISLTACDQTSDRARAHSAAATSSATPLPSASASPAPPTEQVLAVVTGSGELQLYGMAAGHARLLRALPGPAQGRAEDVTIASGPAPRVCATWSTGTTGQLWCYDGGGRPTPIVATGPDPVSPALSADGMSLAWGVDDTARGGLTLCVQRSSSSRVQRIPAYPAEHRPDDDATLGLGSLAWQGNDTVLVGHSYDDDVNGSIARVRLDSPPPDGWADHDLVPSSTEWPVLYGATSSTTTGSVLALLEGFGGDDHGGERFEAVELDVSTGRLLSVVAVPGRGRITVSVSGGPRGIVYRTQSDTDTRTYWRGPGQAHGTLATGLPESAREVIAQP